MYGAPEDPTYVIVRRREYPDTLGINTASQFPCLFCNFFLCTKDDNSKVYLVGVTTQNDRTTPEQLNDTNASTTYERCRVHFVTMFRLLHSLLHSFSTSAEPDGDETIADT
jgi:hypothetical protein